MTDDVFAIDAIPQSPRHLTQRVLQVREMLGLYNAELASILGLCCADIGRLAGGRVCLQQGSHAWHEAQRLLRCYQLLYALQQGDGVAMRHWLRVGQLLTGGEIPHRMLIDEGRLAGVVTCLQAAVPVSQNGNA